MFLVGKGTIRSSRQRQELGGERLHADAGKKQAVQEVVNERPRVVIRLAFPPLQILRFALHPVETAETRKCPCDVSVGKLKGS